MTIMAQNSVFNIEDINAQLGDAFQAQEKQMDAVLRDLRNNPNPTQQQMLAYQAQLQIWSNLVNMQTQIQKVYGDTMKQVVTNMGS